jgi:hypothetical protein
LGIRSAGSGQGTGNATLFNSSAALNQLAQIIVHIPDGGREVKGALKGGWRNESAVVGWVYRRSSRLRRCFPSDVVKYRIAKLALDAPIVPEVFVKVIGIFISCFDF